MSTVGKADAKPICFVISPIGSQASDIRRRSDQVLKHIIKRAVEPAGYEVVRADHLSEPGMITVQVIQHLLADDLVIADLTDHNANVFYELAVRHAAAKPIIHIIDASQEIPFDVSGFRTVKFDHRDLDSAEAAVQEIAMQAEWIRKGGAVDTPVKLTLTIDRLAGDKSDEKVAIGEILTAVARLSSEVRALVETNRVSPSFVSVSGGMYGLEHVEPPGNFNLGSLPASGYFISTAPRGIVQSGTKPGALEPPPKKNPDSK